MKEYSEFLKEICEKYANDFHPKKFVYKTERDILTDERYNIILLYKRVITEQITSFSKELNRIIPCTIYDNNKCHTTVGVFRGHEINSKIPKDNNEILTRLKEVAEKIKNKINIRDIKIYLGKMLVNKNSVILSGFPDKNFWKLQKILDQENNQYLRLRLAWGAHITAGRFNKNESDLELILRLHNLVNEFNIIEKVSPIDIAITKFKVSPGVYEQKILWQLFGDGVNLTTKRKKSYNDPLQRTARKTTRRR